MLAWSILSIGELTLKWGFSKVCGVDAYRKTYPGQLLLRRGKEQNATRLLPPARQAKQNASVEGSGRSFQGSRGWASAATGLVPDERTKLVETVYY